MDNKFDMEQFLKNALDNETKDKEQTKESMQKVMKPLMNVIEKGALVKVAKLAQGKTDETINKLISDLNKNKDIMDSTKFRQFANISIKEAAARIKVLDVFIISGGLIGISDENEYEKALEAIISICE